VSAVGKTSVDLLSTKFEAVSRANFRCRWKKIKKRKREEGGERRGRREKGRKREEKKKKKKQLKKKRFYL